MIVFPHHRSQTRLEMGRSTTPHLLIPTTTKFLGLNPYSKTASTQASSTPCCSFNQSHLSLTIKLSTTPALKAIKLHVTLNSFFNAPYLSAYSSICSSVMPFILSLTLTPLSGSFASFSNAPRKYVLNEP